MQRNYTGGASIPGCMVMPDGVLKVLGVPHNQDDRHRGRLSNSLSAAFTPYSDPMSGHTHDSMNTLRTPWCALKLGTGIKACAPFAI